MSQILCLVYEEYARDARVRRHCRALAAAGYAVDVLAVGDERSVTAAAEDGVSLQSLTRSKYRGASRTSYLIAYASFGVRSFKAVLSRVLFRRVDLIWVNNPPDFLVLAAWPGRVRGVPIVLDVHDMTTDLYAAKFGRSGLMVRAAIAAMERFSFRFADALVTIHDLYRERIHAIVGSSVPVAAIMNVPDNDDWLEVGDQRVDPPERNGPLRLGHHGTIVERFGVDLALEAVAALRAEHVEVTLAILGNGDFADEVERRISELGIGGWVQFDRRTFAAEDLPVFTASIDVGVAPYRPSRFAEHGMPTKILEYLALGVPSIVTHTRLVRSDLSEAVRIIGGNSVPELCDAIREMLDPSVRRRYRKAGRRLAHAYSWPAQRAELLDFTRRVISRTVS